jgi:hypothetical protein
VWKLAGFRKRMQMKRDVRHTAECENLEELEVYADAKGMPDTLQSVETGRNLKECADVKLMRNTLQSVETGRN